MGRPQEVPLDEAPDVHAAPLDEEEIGLTSGAGKDAASSAAVDSLPALSVGYGGSKAHSSAESMDAPAENGDHSSATEGKESSAAEAGARCEKAEMEMAERKRHRMYFVREPSQAQSSDKIDAEISSLIEKATKQREQLDKLELAFNEAREKRDAARSEHNPARERFMSCKGLYDKKMEELKPYTEASKAQRAEKDRFDSHWSDLTFRNEQQLDEAIASINYRQAHETISPAEEKKLIAELKKLEEQRSRIREFTQAKAERDGKQADEGQATYSKADLDAMWTEVSTLRAERDTLKGIADSLKKPLEEHTAAADELWKKKGDKRREWDELNAEIREKKKERNFNSKAFSENRRLSQSVREMIRAKKFEEARRACEEQAVSTLAEKLNQPRHERMLQTERAMGRLLSQPAEWTEYARLWNEQRGHSIWEAEDWKQRQSAAKPAPNSRNDAAKAARIAAAYAADKAAALKAAEERIPEMRRKEEERAKARRADRGLKPLRDSEPAAGALSNGDGPHTEPSDASEEKEAVGGSVPALQSVHLGAAQMQDLMPGKPAAKRSSKAKADARPAVVLPPVLDNDEPFVPPAAILKRDETAASEEDEKEKVRLRQAEAAREAEARKERKRRANERKAAAKAAASKAKELQKSAAAAVFQPEPKADDPVMEAEQPASADAAVIVNASDVGTPAAQVEAAEKPASKAPARSTRVAAPAAKIRLGSKKKGWKAHVDKFLKSALQFLGSATGMAVLAMLALLVLLGVYGNRPQSVPV